MVGGVTAQWPTSCEISDAKKNLHFAKSPFPVLWVTCLSATIQCSASHEKGGSAKEIRRNLF